MRYTVAWLLLLALMCAGSAPGSAQDKTVPVVEQAAAPKLIGFTHPVVFTMALGSDAGTNAQIAVTLASMLKNDSKDKQTTYVPEGGWTLADFIAQCSFDKVNTKGAFIVLPPSLSSQSDNYLVAIRSSEMLQFNAMLAVCEDKDGKAAMSIEWSSDTAKGEYGRTVIQFLPFAVLTSVYLLFSPQRTYQTTATTVYPVPNPVPPGGAQSTVATQSQTVLNPSGAGALQQGIVNSVGLASSLLFGRQYTSNHFTLHAAEDAVTKFINSDGYRKFKATCPNQAATAAPAYCALF